MTESRPAAEHLRAGNQLLAEGDLEGAAQRYRTAVAIDVKSTDAHINLGFVLIELGRSEEAVPVLTRAVCLQARSYDGHYLLGRALIVQNDIAEALVHLQRAAALDPRAVAGALELGKLLHDVARFEQAERVLRKALESNPDSGDLLHFLGNVVAQQMRFHEALDIYRQSLSLDSSQAAVLNNIGLALVNLCEFAEAAQAARAALRLDPKLHAARSNLLMALSCDAACSLGEYLDEAEQFGTAVATGQQRERSNLVGEVRVDAKPIRVGFVSGDLRNHPVGYFLESVLAHWDHTDMVAFAYANHAGQDDLTARLRSHFDDWRDISRLDDAAAARLIVADGIDVLFDLSGHTSGNRLPLFARRPAPIQVSWLGYWATTGLPAVDFILADPVSLPVEEHSQFTERVLYLPETRLCFTAPALTELSPVSPLPAIARDHVTFGSFQRLSKIHDGVLALWARVLDAVPGARLRMQSPHLGDETVRTVVSKRLEAAGIALARVTLAGPGTRAEYLAAHAEVDLLLDTFPHSGATTTCEALWMGVPTITLAGRTMLSRQGASILTCVGLADWVAVDEDSYVERAARFADDREALARLRAGLRDRVSTSPLFDAARFTAALQRTIAGIEPEGGPTSRTAPVPATTSR